MEPDTEKTDNNPNPMPSALRTNSAKRPAFGASGKSLSFEEKICTVIPHNSSYDEPEPEIESAGRGCAWWEPDNERNLAEFCMQTSIHGLKYLGEPRRHIFERLFWLMSFVLSVLVTTYLIKNVWLKYSESPVVITFQPFETFIEQIPFPAVTICNMNKVLKSKANEYMREAKGPDNDDKTAEARRNVYYLDHVCSTSNKPFSTIFNYTSTQGTVDPEVLKLASGKIHPGDGGVDDVAEFLQKASQPCTEMLKLCLWQGEVYKCSQLFRPIETNFGKCCTFNMVPQTLLHRYLNDSRDDKRDVENWDKWDQDKEGLVTLSGQANKYPRPRRQYRAGKVSGLAFLADPDLDEYFCTSSDATGFRLATHLSTDLPHITDFGLAIRPNSEHFVTVRPEITLADDIIKEYDRDKRNCYVEGEYPLKYYSYYTPSNCFDECVANLTYEECNCVRYYMPRDSKREICGPGPDKFDCAEAVKKKSFRSGVKNICQHCLPTCTEISYYSDSTSAPFRRRVDLWADNFNISTSWAKRNISIVHVYFGQDSTYARVRSQLFGLTDLIANFGGLMGLCMGFSGLSLVELIYFFTMRVWCRRRRRSWVQRKQNEKEALERDKSQELRYLAVSNRSLSSSSFEFKPTAQQIAAYNNENGHKGKENSSLKSNFPAATLNNDANEVCISRC